MVLHQEADRWLEVQKAIQVEFAAVKLTALSPLVNWVLVQLQARFEAVKVGISWAKD